jgi:hypothetical protein
MQLRHGLAYVAASRARDFDKPTVLTPNGDPTMKNIVFSEVFDKDYIDDQIRRRTARPIISGRSDTANEHAFTSADDMNAQYDEELEHFLEQFEGVNSDYNSYEPDSFLYTHEDQAYDI